MVMARYVPFWRALRSGDQHVACKCVDQTLQLDEACRIGCSRRLQGMCADGRLQCSRVPAAPPSVWDRTAGFNRRREGCNRLQWTRWPVGSERSADSNRETLERSGVVESGGVVVGVGE